MILLVGPAVGGEPARQYQAQDGWRMLQTALPFALKSNREAIRDCFMGSLLEGVVSIFRWRGL
jgi:hypothetical protein